MTETSSNSHFVPDLGEPILDPSPVEAAARRKAAMVDLDPDRTEHEAEEFGPTRKLRMLDDGQIVEITGAPEYEKR